jgi:hypothetical protein
VSKAALQAAYEAFVGTQKAVPRQRDVAARYVGWQIDALASDVMSAVEVLLSTYESAQSAVGEARSMIENPEAASEVFELLGAPQRRFITAFKSVFFFVRAYQDAVCALLFVLSGKRAGRYTSMAKALEKGKPVRQLLDDELAGYGDWFYRWRDDRDKIKRGARFILFFDGDDNLSISFTYPVEMGGMETEEERIGLPRVIEGVQMSTRLTVVAWGQVEGKQL